MILEHITTKVVATSAAVFAVATTTIAQVMPDAGVLAEIAKISAVVFNCIFALGCLYIIFYGVKVNSEAQLRLAEALIQFSEANKRIADAYAQVLQDHRKDQER